MGHDDGNSIASDVMEDVSEVQSVGILPHQFIMRGVEISDLQFSRCS